MPEVTWERPRKPARPIYEPVLPQHSPGQDVTPGSGPQYPPPPFPMAPVGYWPPPSYQAPAGHVAPAPPRWSIPLAVISMTLGISALPASFILLDNYGSVPPFVVWSLLAAIPVVALICGVVSLFQIGRSRGQWPARTMAIIGIVGFNCDVGIVGLILILAVSLKAALNSGLVRM
jgi:hypothetical protein